MTDTLVAWRDEFEIGIKEVDFEHRELIRVINELYAAGREVDLQSALGEIMAQIASHFALEEKDMAALRWKEYEDHKEDHEELLDQLRDIMDDVDEDRPEELGKRLSDWFSEHFRTFDARLHWALH